MIQINLDSPTPIFAQIVEQIKNHIKQGDIAHGDALPSIRQLANDLDINSKTVAKAYQILERDKVIQKKGYRGTFVAPEALQSIGSNINEWITEKMTQTITELRQKGATDSEIRIIFSQIMKK